jgi:hypothetical protein
MERRLVARGPRARARRAHLVDLGLRHDTTGEQVFDAPVFAFLEPQRALRRLEPGQRLIDVLGARAVDEQPVARLGGRLGGGGPLGHEAVLALVEPRHRVAPRSSNAPSSACRSASRPGISNATSTWVTSMIPEPRIAA